MTDVLRLRVLLAGTLCVAGLLVLPAVGAAASQRVGNHVVAWPSDTSLAAVEPGDMVRVSVKARKARRSAVVSLARVTESGTPIASVARRTLRNGTFAARVPAGSSGFYRLKVTSGGLFSQVIFDAQAPGSAATCSDEGDAEADLAVSPTEARAGETIEVTLTNTGPTCFRTALGVTWQINSNGLWIDIPLTPAPPALVDLQPGQSRSESFVVPAGTAPGQYRIVKRFDDEDISETVTVIA